MSGIYIVGDIHADFEYLTKDLIKKKSPDILLCCGDFGYWIDYAKNKFYHEYLLDNSNCKVYFCDGNHERHDLLKELVQEHGWKNPIEIKNNVFYCPRGSSLGLPNNKRVLFFGGADSIDKHIRTPGYNWFAEENITEDEFNRVDTSLKYNIVISHTCPSMLNTQMRLSLGLSLLYPKIADPNSDVLQRIFNRVKPEEWFFGHWHTNYIGVHEDCKFMCLNMVPRENYYFKYEI